MAYIVHDQALLTRIHLEKRELESHDLNDLAGRLENCAQLDAVFHEGLRLTTSSASVRTVVSATELGNKVLRPGGKVLIPYRQLHLNDNAFGGRVREFDPARYLQNKYLSRNPSYRPFGGGTTYCPGRHMAKCEVLVFVALAINRFELRVARSQGALDQIFPRLDEKRPCLEVMMQARLVRYCFRCQARRSQS